LRTFARNMQIGALALVANFLVVAGILLPAKPTNAARVAVVPLAVSSANFARPLAEVRISEIDLSELGAQERSAVVVRLTIIEEGPTPDHLQRGALVGAGCGQGVRTIYSTNAVGTKMWRYRMAVPWCWNSARVVSSVSAPIIEGYVYGAAGALGWDYEGVKNQTGYWPLGKDRYQYNSYSQGGFKYCPIRINCIQHIYPYMTQGLTGDGWAWLLGWGNGSYIDPSSPLD